MTPSGLAELSHIAPMSQALIQSSALCYYVDRAFAKLRGGTHVDTTHSGMLDDRANWLALEWTPEIWANVEYSMAMIRRTIGMLRAAGVKVMLTGVPHYPQFTGEWSARPHEVLKCTAESEGIAYLDSYTAIRQAVQTAPPGTYYWPSDPTHFNIAGNRLWAEAQLQFLLDPRNQLLAGP
jgi:lysophospholipase L1-like esterase